MKRFKGKALRTLQRKANEHPGTVQFFFARPEQERNSRGRMRPLGLVAAITYNPATKQKSEVHYAE